MTILLYFLLACMTAGRNEPVNTLQNEEIKIVHELFRLRNEHKADSAEQLFADTVLVYMKYLRNVPKKKITESDRNFWKAHPTNKFEITAPVQITVQAGITTAIIFGKEYLDGTAFQYERIEIKFDRNKKINSFRGFALKNKR
ncbi:MAG: hypothetical protein JNK27_05330 [Chitinophagaceae bacterium]|nr:hypothetical protein [Chitinophagaceae bacterium]